MKPKDAAAVIVVRETSDDIEVLLVGRNRRSSFMSQAYVFPGGAVHEEDAGLEEAAARELFEEAGILIAQPQVDSASLESLRTDRLSPLQPRLGDLNLEIDAAALRFYSHWITPSVERKRFSARFFVAKLPEGQQEVIDGQEVVTSRWVSPKVALGESALLRLPPPQIRTFVEMAECRSFADVIKLADRHVTQPAPIMPRAIKTDEKFALALPWDPDYEGGEGESLAMPHEHPQAWGPSRFIMTDDGGWQHIEK